MGTRLIYRNHGKPLEVLEAESFQPSEPGKGQVRIRMLYANINPSDLGMIGGSYGKLPDLPAVAGREGIGEIETLGPDCPDDFKPGDRVRIPENLGAWQTHCIANVSELIRIPPEISPDTASTLFINPPTALMLLESFVDLKPGDWVIQNAGNSSVGCWVIQLAKARGIRTISTVRRMSLADELQSLGADVVIEDTDDYVKKIKDLTGGNKPKLALNSVGGESVSRQIKVLDEGGVCVTFGGMVGDPVRYPTRFLIFNDVQLRGFWMDKWMRNHSHEDIRKLYNRVFEQVVKADIRTPVQAEYSLMDFKAALETYPQPRMGKILLKG